MQPARKNTTLRKSGSAEADVLSAQIRKRFANSGGDFELEVAFALPPGITILFGPSGAGKTTLLDCIAGLAVPDAGRIVMETQNFFDSTHGTNLAVRRRRIGYVFQDLALFPHLSVKRNIEYGLTGLDMAERHRRSDAILESLRIAHLRARRPDAISGGERQRGALARAPGADPCLLL